MGKIYDERSQQERNACVHVYDPKCMLEGKYGFHVDCANEVVNSVEQNGSLACVRVDSTAAARVDRY